VRVIAATNRNLREGVESGRFRSDLFYRLNVVPIELPALRERRSDIPQLVTFYLSRFSKRLGKTIDGFSRQSMENLMTYSWPGNIRELQNVIERAVILATGPTLRLDSQLMPISTPTNASEAADSATQPFTLDEVNRNHILATLKLTAGVVDGSEGAAKILGLHPNTLRHRMKKLGIVGSRHRPS
jgi:formate hydrogenlyase transcriptional activator